jgi:succinate dehydrogenase / fumarate reductase flavoprotein subunit
MLDSLGSLESKWTTYRSTVKLVSPANKRKLEVIVVGTGLAGASAAASLAELGYKVKVFCFQDSPASCPLYLGAGWHQCSQELQE